MSSKIFVALLFFSIKALAALFQAYKPVFNTPDVCKSILNKLRICNYVWWRRGFLLQQ